MSGRASSTFQVALETAEQLAPEDQEMLIDILRRRLIERRRAELAEDISAAREAYRRGDVRCGTVDDLIAELAE
ncbi:MAG: hypothetical protein ABIK79_06135 [Chloroflexota bacterium]|nr:hypothetical protein [Anaerolineae bacterium]